MIHNHFDCPCCGRSYASTSLYGDTLSDYKGDEFDCEDCGSEFKHIGYNDNWEVEIEIINDKSNKEG